jgi:hypothetical protein
VKLINGNLFVTYAPAGHDQQTGAHPGQGAVAAFTTSGRFLNQLISGSKLAAPWGITLAPAGFGTFSGDLLVGNFAFNDSDINAFDPSTGAYRGTVSDANGHPIFNPGLWTLTFGNGVNGGDPNTLYFTAGINGETDGLFGSVQAIPPLSVHAPIVPNLPNGAFQTVSTVPANGDLNPYGVAFVPQGFPSGGLLNPGDILVSNFNSSANLQGTGTTIVRITPSGGRSLFFQGPSTPGQLGLTTALGVLKSGFVIVGNLPATYDSKGHLVSIGQGSLLILDRNGNVVSTLSDSALLDGPWDLTVNDQGSRAQVFVSNVLNGVVTRIDLTIPKGGNPIVGSLTRIASGYLTRTDPAALVIGPTGLAYDATRDILYVASTGDNAIFSIAHALARTSDAGIGRLVYQDDAHLRGPLGLVLAPNGNLITSNGDAVNPDPNQASELVEFTTSGRFVGQFSIDPAQGGAFGLAVSNVGGILRLAAVEDVTNSVDVWTFQTDPASHHAVPGANNLVIEVSSPSVPSITSMVTSTGSQSGTAPNMMLLQGSSSQPAAPIALATNSTTSATSTNRKRGGVHHVFLTSRNEHHRPALFRHRHGARGHHNHNHRPGMPSGQSKTPPVKPTSPPRLPSGPAPYMPVY